jgi:hypothetical protein
VIVHVVLFRPRADLSETLRRELIEGLTRAAVQIPSIRRFHVGRRVLLGVSGYEQAAIEAYDYAAIVEFDDREGLLIYLAHPAHRRIGDHFTTSADAAVAYDYEMVEATRAGDLLPDG